MTVQKLFAAPWGVEFIDENCGDPEVLLRKRQQTRGQ